MQAPAGQRSVQRRVARTDEASSLGSRETTKGAWRGKAPVPAMGAAGLIAMLAAAGPVGAEVPQGAPYEEIGRAYVAQVGVEESADPDELLKAGMARFSLGAFDLWFPARSLGDRDASNRIRTAVRTIVASHRIWIDTVDPDEERVDRKTLDADAKTIDKWIKGWSAKELANVAPGDALGAKLKAKDKELAALSRFQGTRWTAEGSGKVEEPADLILIPDRAGFVPLCAAIGVVRPDQRGNYWVAGMADWVEFRWEDTRVVALEFADTDRSTWDGGLPMDVHNDEGLEQQVAQLAFGSLILARFGNRIDADFSLALCNNLVVDQFGEVDTRTDGDLRPRTAPARKVFVPGGLSQGGRLPRNNADSPWRATRGADRFVEALAASQERGAKEAKARGALDRFAILSDDTASRFVAQAPFFGPSAAETLVPGEEFQGEWLELMRSYRVAFCYWLREHGMGKRGPSRAAFQALLASLAPGAEVDFAAAVEAAYGAPVSSASPGEGDLEGRFLAWLAKEG